MAKKRTRKKTKLNKALLLWAVSGVCLLGGGLLAYRAWGGMHSGLREEAMKAAADKDYELAWNKLRSYVGKTVGRNDADAQYALYQVARMRTSFDDEKAWSFYSIELPVSVLSLNPRHRPMLEAHLSSVLEMYDSPGTAIRNVAEIERVRRLGEQLLTIDPGSKVGRETLAMTKLWALLGRSEAALQAADAAAVVAELTELAGNDFGLNPRIAEAITTAQLLELNLLIRDSRASTFDDPNERMAQLIQQIEGRWSRIVSAADAMGPATQPAVPLSTQPPAEQPAEQPAEPPAEPLAEPPSRSAAGSLEASPIDATTAVVSPAAIDTPAADAPPADVSPAGAGRLDPADRSRAYSRAAMANVALAERSQNAERRGNSFRRFLQLLAQSAAAARPQDRDYQVRLLEYCVSLSRTIGTDAFGEIERVLREGIRQLPGSIALRVQLADILQFQQRTAEALQVLDFSLEPTTDFVGVQGFLHRISRNEVRGRRAYLRSLQLATTPPDQQAALKASIAEDRGMYFQAVTAIDDPLRRLIEAAELIAARQDAKARETLEVAYRLTATQQGLRMDITAEVPRLLMFLYDRLNEPQKATDLARQVAEATRLPWYDLQYVERLLRMRSFPQAREAVAAMLRRNPDLLIYRVFEAQAHGDQPAEARRLLDALPEQDAVTTALKLNTAMYLRIDEVVDRLGDEMQARNPGDIQLISRLIAYNEQGGRRERLRAVLTKAVADNPQNDALQRALDLAGATTMDQARQSLPPMIQKLLDAEQAAQAGDREAQFAALLEADKLDTAAAGQPAEQAFRLALDRIVEARRQLVAAGANPPEALRQNLDLWSRRSDSLLERLRQLNSDSVGGRLFDVRLQLAKGQTAAAQNTIDAVVRDFPNLADARVVQAIVQAEAGDPQQAVISLERALAASPGNIEALRYIISLQRGLNNPQQEKRWIDHARARFPQDIGFELAHLDWEQTRGNIESIIPRREELVRQVPDNADFAFNLGQTYLAMAVRAARAGDSTAATDWGRKAQETFRAAAEKWQGSDLRFIQRFADVSLQIGQYDAGADALKRLSEDPAHAANRQVQVMRAQHMLNGGRIEDARAYLETLVLDDPSADIGQRMLLATIYLNTNNPARALELLEAGGDNLMLTGFRVDILSMQGRFDEALALIETELQRSRSDPSMSYRLAALIATKAQLLAGARRDAEAVTLATEALAKDPNLWVARLVRASVALRGASPDFSAIVADLIAVRNAQPNNVQARMQLYAAYRGMNRVDDARIELEDIVADNPDEKVPLTALLNLYAGATPPRWGEYEAALNAARQHPTLVNDAELFIHEMTLWFGRNNTEAAINAARRAMQLAPQDLRVVQAYQSALLRANLLDEALADIDRVLRQEPRLWWALRNRGAINARRSPSGAVADFRLALTIADDLRDRAAQLDVVRNAAGALGPGAAIELVQDRIESDPQWRLLGVDLNREAGNLAKARELVARNVAQARSMPRELMLQALNQAGQFYLAVEPQDAPAAVNAFKMLVDQGFNDKLAFNNYAYALTLIGGEDNHRRAAEIAERAYNLATNAPFPDPNTDAYVMDTYGWALVLTGRTEDGIAKLREALTRKPLPETYYHLGEAYLRLQNRALAERNLRDSLDMIERMVQNQQSVDASLRPRVEEALRNAQELSP